MRRARVGPRLIGATLAAAIFVAAGMVAAQGADGGWVIDRLAIHADVRPDGTVDMTETIEADFGGLSRHGIFRDLTYRFSYDATHVREYGVELKSVTAPDGRPIPVQASTVGAVRRFRIGDPNRTVSGRQTYRITYVLRQALNGFPDHDELYWNATGDWPVPIAEASVEVTAPAESVMRVDCFQGRTGSTERCLSAFESAHATFGATRTLAAGEQMTIVVGLRKGAVPDPTPRLIARSAGSAASRPVELFATTPTLMTLLAVGLLAAVGGVGALWWRVGRDRQYVALHRQGRAGDAETRVPFFAAEPVAVEFEPPDRLRPAEIGLILDERADTLDVTATIIDLAVRGYLTITEVPKTWWLGSTDWQLDRQKPADDGLREYERIVFDGLFESGDSCTMSSLKEKFYKTLGEAKAALYRDGVDRGWFPRNPDSVRTVWRVVGVLLLAAGVALVILLGARWQAGLLGVPVAVAGLGLAILAGAMPRRTAAGRALMYRALGFARYIRTAEAHQQAFAERANVFTAYLPYAIAFRCVDKWARAFKDIDMQAATAGWYAGSSPFTTSAFTSSVNTFSSSMSAAIASTPGGSGSSGFSGGSAGGGGGGGGGGSW